MVAKNDKPAPAHPTYAVMVVNAIKELKDRKGSSKQAVVKYVSSNYHLKGNVNVHVKLAIVRLIANGDLERTKFGGAGLNGRFSLSKAAAEKFKMQNKQTSVKAKPARKPATKKPAAKKAKPASPKKKVVKASPKKKAAKKPKTPTKKKSPAKSKKTTKTTEKKKTLKQATQKKAASATKKAAAKKAPAKKKAPKKK